MAKPTKRDWIKMHLEARGYSQRDLARAWGISEGSISRFLQGVENTDLQLSRSAALAKMLDISIDELANALGLGDKVTVPPAVPPSGAPQLGTVTFTDLEDGKCQVLVYLVLPWKEATDMIATAKQKSTK